MARELPKVYEPQQVENRIYKMWEEGKSVQEIADYFGRKNSSIITRLRKLGL